MFSESANVLAVLFAFPTHPLPERCIGRQVPGTFQVLEAWPPGSWGCGRGQQRHTLISQGCRPGSWQAVDNQSGNIRASDPDFQSQEHRVAVELLHPRLLPHHERPSAAVQGEAPTLGIFTRERVRHRQAWSQQPTSLESYSNEDPASAVEVDNASSRSSSGSMDKDVRSPRRDYFELLEVGVREDSQSGRDGGSSKCNSSGLDETHTRVDEGVVGNVVAHTMRAGFTGTLWTLGAALRVHHAAKHVHPHAGSQEAGAPRLQLFLYCCCRRVGVAGVESFHARCRWHLRKKTAARSGGTPSEASFPRAHCGPPRLCSTWAISTWANFYSGQLYLGQVLLRPILLRPIPLRPGAT